MIPGSANPLLLTSADSGFPIERSLRFNSGDSSKISRTPSSASNRKTWTMSYWVKRAKLSTEQMVFSAASSSSDRVHFYYESTDNIAVYSPSFYYTTNVIARDPGAWQHLVFACDTTQSTDTDRFKIYVNSVLVTSFVNQSHPSQNLDTPVSNNILHQFSGRGYNSSSHADVYLAEINFVDGQALDPTSFGAFDDNGVWQAIDTAGLTFGTNGFRLKFADNSSNAALGTDTSGVSPANTWTVNNLMASAPGLATANQGMDVVTWTGNGGDRDIGGLAFQPDFVWIKKRNSSSSGDHMLYDVVRGATKVLKSNSTAAEITDASTLDAFNSDGFSIGGGWEVNKSGDTYVAWTWKAGGAASSNTDGTITSSVSANTSYGFSICTYTGTEGGTFGHGLNAAPKFVMVKRRNTTADWCLWHTSIPNTQYLMLNQTAAANTFNVWGNTSPTSSVVSVSGDSYTGNNGDTYVAYCWSEVAGFSKFGSYTGTGAAGVVVTTGFKPRFILIKNVSTGSDWRIFDTARSPSNPADKLLFPNATDAEKTNSDYNTDITATGFTVNGTHSGLNTNGDTYIYAAYASKPSGEGIDSLVDTPTNGDTASDTGAGGEVVGNYATLNPLALPGGGTLSEGNLKYLSGGGWDPTSATIGVNSGKWYWEYLFEGTNMECGITAHPNTDNWIGNYQESIGIGNGGDLYLNGDGGTNPSGWSTIATGSIVGNELDLDNGTFRHYVNGVAQSYATQSLDTTLTWFPAGSVYASSHLTYNFGQRAFAYQNAGTNRPSADFKCLTTANLPEPTIADGSKYFDTIIASGTGASKTFTMPGGFGPGLVWAKQRNGATNHALFDVLRGATKRLVSNSNQAEDTQANQLSAFTSDGFTYGSDIPNASGNTGVYWAWDAGSSNTTIAAGSLNSSAYNQTDWSGNTTATNIATNVGNDLASVFDGNLANGTRAANNGGTGTLQWSSGTIQGNVRVYTGLAGTQGLTYYNGSTSNTIASVNNGWNDLGNIDLTRLDFVYSGGNITFINAIELDGKLLINNSVTPTNVPSIASTVRASASSGFSIVSYTGTGANATFGHGLNAAPEFVIVKTRTSGSINWTVWHEAIAATDYLTLNTSNAKGTAAAVWNSTAPTSSVINVGTDVGTNKSSDNYIAYCFSPVESHSSFGSWIGTGDADGPLLYTGFRPAWIMYKRKNGSGNWVIRDTKRSLHNVSNTTLVAESSEVESTSSVWNVDILSNGFKIRSTGAGTNNSGDTYIYLAFAENPFKTARAR
jgi:hypothetical protein